MGILQITGQNSNENYSWGGTFNTSSKEKNSFNYHEIVLRIELMRLFIFLSIIVLFHLAACQSKEHATQPILVKDCFRNVIDSSYSGFNVNYFFEDTMMRFKVGHELSSQEMLTDFRFNCSAPGYLIPRYYKSDSNSIVFKRGQGSSFREYVVFFINDSILKCRHFSDVLGFDLISRSIYSFSSEKYGEVMKVNVLDSSNKEEVIGVLGDDFNYINNLFTHDFIIDSNSVKLVFEDTTFIFPN